MSNNGIHSGERPFYLFLFSAKTREGLIRRLADLKEWIKEEADASTDVGNIAYTLSVGRSHFPERAAVIAGDLQELETELLRTLEALAADTGSASRVLRRNQNGREDQRRLDGIMVKKQAGLQSPGKRWMRPQDCIWKAAFAAGTSCTATANITKYRCLPIRFRNTSIGWS